MKIDFLVICVDDFFIVQVTKCSSGYPDLKVLFTDVLKDHLSNKQDLDNNLVVAALELKSTNYVQTSKVIYSDNSTFKIMHEPTIKTLKDFISLKCYISIKLLVHMISYT
jgi:hypothetical protein